MRISDLDLTHLDLTPGTCIPRRGVVALDVLQKVVLPPILLSAGSQREMCESEEEPTSIDRRQLRLQCCLPRLERRLGGEQVPRTNREQRNESRGQGDGGCTASGGLGDRKITARRCVPMNQVVGRAP